MAFQSRRLRVQLPCGDESILEHEARIKTPTVHYTCAGIGSRLNPTCGPAGSFACYWCSTTVTGTVCAYIGSLVYDRESDDTLVVEADQLPVIRAELELQLKRLEGQLKEIEVAEAAVAEREAGA